MSVHHCYIRGHDSDVIRGRVISQPCHYRTGDAVDGSSGGRGGVSRGGGEDGLKIFRSRAHFITLI